MPVTMREYIISIGHRISFFRVVFGEAVVVCRLGDGGGW